MKKTFQTRPQPSTSDIERFVKTGAGKDQKDDPVKTVKTSIDFPEELHRQFKSACARTGHKMGFEIIALVERRTKELLDMAQH